MLLQHQGPQMDGRKERRRVAAQGQAELLCGEGGCEQQQWQQQQQQQAHALPRRRLKVARDDLGMHRRLAARSLAGQSGAGPVPPVEGPCLLCRDDRREDGLGLSAVVQSCLRLSQNVVLGGGYSTVAN